MIKTVFGVVVAIVTLTACSTDDSESANRLFVEAVNLISSAEHADSEERVRLLEEAHVALDTIVARYPSTDLAVELSSGQAIGEVSLKILANELTDARVDHCALSPNVSCIADWLTNSISNVEPVEYEWDRYFALYGIVQIHSASGDFMDALNILNMIDDDETKRWAMVPIAGGQARYDLYSDALQSAEMAGSDNRHLALLEIAKAQAAAGRDSDYRNTLTLVSEIVESFEDSRVRARISIEVAKVHRLAGHTSRAVDALSGAMQTAESIDGPEENVRILQSIAELQTEFGLSVDATQTLSRAIQIARGIEDVEDRIERLASIAELQFELGFVPEANRTLNVVKQDVDSMEGDIFKDFSLERIANVQARSGAYSDALDTVRSTDFYLLGIASSEASVLAIIAGTQAEQDSHDEAMQTAQAIDDAAHRAAAFTNIARAYQKSGFEDEATLTIARARQITELIDSNIGRLSSLADIATYQFESNNFVDALTTIAHGIRLAESAEDPSDRLRGLQSLVMVLSCATYENC